VCVQMCYSSIEFSESLKHFTVVFCSLCKELVRREMQMLVSLMEVRQMEDKFCAKNIPTLFCSNLTK